MCVYRRYFCGGPAIAARHRAVVVGRSNGGVRVCRWGGWDDGIEGVGGLGGGEGGPFERFVECEVAGGQLFELDSVSMMSSWWRAMGYCTPAMTS